MKRFSLSLLPLLAFVAFSCTDSTAPANSNMVRISTNPGSLGDPPPPPVDAAIVICVNSVCTEVDGSYFSNGGTTPALSAVKAANSQGDGVCVFTGPSWVKFSNKQSDAIVSANGEIRCSHLTASGHGTIEFAGITVFLDQVILFDNQPTCSTFCGSFTATTDPPGIAHGTVLNRQFFNDFCRITEGGVFCGEG